MQALFSYSQAALKIHTSHTNMQQIMNMSMSKNVMSMNITNMNTKIQNLYTVYSEDLELFAEAEPFTKGEKSHILAHFTKLSDFKALDSSQVTLRLIVDGKELTQVRKKAKSKGIYSFSIKPEVRGKGRLIFDIERGTYKKSIVVEKVQVFKNEHDAEHAAEQHHIHSVNTIPFTKEQSWKINFATANPAYEAFGELIKTSAKVISSQNDEAKIVAKSSGLVFFAKDDFVIGSKANKNQALFTIVGQELNENNNTANFKEIKNNYEKAKANFERLDLLEKDQIISKKNGWKPKLNMRTQNYITKSSKTASIAKDKI